MFKEVSLKRDMSRIETTAHNHINDQLWFYKHDGIYTDDGHIANELDMAGLSDDFIKSECRRVADWFFLDFDEKNLEFISKNKREDEAIIALIQATTALSQVIIDYQKAKYKK